MKWQRQSISSSSEQLARNYRRTLPQLENKALRETNRRLRQASKVPRVEETADVLHSNDAGELLPEITEAME